MPTWWRRQRPRRLRFAVFAHMGQVVRHAVRLRRIAPGPEWGMGAAPWPQASAVNGQTEVFLDGGIRRGSDVVKALCLGAKAVLVGRACAYGLGAAGNVGVARAIDILRVDVTRTLKLLGCASVKQLNESFVEVPPEWQAA